MKDDHVSDEEYGRALQGLLHCLQKDPHTPTDQKQADECLACMKKYVRQKENRTKEATKIFKQLHKATGAERRRLLAEMAKLLQTQGRGRQ